MTARRRADRAWADRRRDPVDDSIPLREHLEALLAAQGIRFDDLRAEDKRALEAAFASSTKAVEAAFASAERAVQTALAAQKADALRADAAMEKRLDELNDMRKAVATSAEVDAVKGVVSAQQRAFDKLESKIEAQQAATAAAPAA